MDRQDINIDIVSSVSDALVQYVLHSTNDLGTKYHPLRVQCFIEAKTESKVPIQVLDVIPSESSVEIKIKVLGKVYGLRARISGFRQ